jgi:hypothetical protein
MKKKTLGVLLVAAVAGSVVGLKAHSAKLAVRDEIGTAAGDQSRRSDRDGRSDAPARARLTRFISVLARARAASMSEAASKTSEPEGSPVEITPTSTRNPDFDELLDTEPENRAWQDQMATEFTKAYEAFPGVHVQSVRCGGDFCRLEMSTPVGDDAQHAVFNQFQHIPDLKGMLTLKVRDDVDPPYATLYFSRAGVVLPFVAKG